MPQIAGAAARLFFPSDHMSPVQEKAAGASTDYRDDSSSNSPRQFEILAPERRHPGSQKIHQKNDRTRIRRMTSKRPTVAILDWGHLYEDFLSSIGMDLDSFRRELSGGWLFGYIKALECANVRSVFLFVSAKVTKPWRFVHEPSGAEVTALPAPFAYRSARKIIVDPYAVGLDQALGSHASPMLRPLLWRLKEVAPYLATPILGLARELRSRNVDAVICQEYESPRFDVVAALCLALRIPVFASFQGGNWQQSRLERPIRSYTLARSAGLIIGSSEEIERIQHTYGYPKERIAWIFNPLELDQWTPGPREEAKRALDIPRNAPVVVWHGRVDLKRKGLDVLLESWRSVSERLAPEEPWLVVVGTGQDAVEFGVRLKDIKIERLLWVNEYVRDKNLIRRYLRAGDVYVFPSRHEGFPVAPIEAMALGLPVVAARAAGVPDIFAAGEQHGAVLVDPGDPEALAEALVRVLSDADFRASLGMRARLRALDAFDVVTVGHRLRNFVLPGFRESAS